MALPGYRKAVLACFFQALVLGGNILLWTLVLPGGTYSRDLRYHTEHVWIPWMVYIGLAFLASICATVGTLSLHRAILLTVRE